MTTQDADPYSKKIEDILKSAKDKAQSSNTTFLLWAVALFVLFINNIIPQFNNIIVFSSYQSKLSDSHGAISTKEASLLFTKFKSIRSEGGEKNDSPKKQNEVYEYGKETLSAILDESIELPLGIKLKIRNTFLPILWCLVFICLFHYLISSRNHVFRLIVLALELEKEGANCKCYKLYPPLDLPWWTKPTKTIYSDNECINNLQNSIGWTSTDFFKKNRHFTQLLLFAIFSFSLYVSWQSEALVQQELRFNNSQNRIMSYFEIFGILEVTSLLALWSILFLYDLSKQQEFHELLENKKISLEDRRLVFKLWAIGLTALILPTTNFAKSYLSNQKPPRNPRYHQVKKAEKHPLKSYVVEKRVQGELSSNKVKPSIAYQQLFQALKNEPNSLRLYDRIAALTAQHNLSKERDELIAFANKELRKTNKNKLSKFNTDDLQLEPLNSININTTDYKSEVKKDLRRDFLIRVFTGVPYSDPKLNKKSYKRCDGKIPIPRLRNKLPISIEQQLQKRIENWKDPNSKWLKKWSSKPLRQWQLPEATKFKDSKCTTA